MQLKIIDIINLLPLYGTIKDLVLPIKTSYKLSKLFKALNKENEFYKDSMNKLINEYSVKDNQGKPLMTNDGVKIQESRLNECQEKVNELLEWEVTIPDIKFAVEELEKMNLSMESFMLLENFIEEEKEQDG